VFSEKDTTQGGTMVNNEAKTVTELFLEKTVTTCDKEFSDLLQPDSAVRHGDAYGKYLDYAMTRLEGMEAFAEGLLHENAALMATVLGILAKWRNRLSAARDSKENLRVFARTEREIVAAFREFCSKSVTLADKLARENPQVKPNYKGYGHYYKEGALQMLCELYLMPELFEISERFPINYREDIDNKEAGIKLRQPEKHIMITVELTEKEAAACDILLSAGRKFRNALADAATEQP
jgi:hypothetical protein